MLVSPLAAHTNRPPSLFLRLGEEAVDREGGCLAPLVLSVWSGFRCSPETDGVLGRGPGFRSG